MLQGKLSAFWSNATVIAVLAIALASAISAVGVMLIGDGRLADVPGAIIGVVDRAHGDDSAASHATSVAQPVRTHPKSGAVHARRQAGPAAAVTFAPQAGPAVVAVASTPGALPARPGRRPAPRRSTPARPSHRSSPAPRRTATHRPTRGPAPSAPPAAAARPAPAPVAASTVPAAPVATTPAATTPAATTPPAPPVTTGPAADPPPVTTPPPPVVGGSGGPGTGGPGDPGPPDTTPPPVDTTPPPVDPPPPPAAQDGSGGNEGQGSGEGAASSPGNGH